MLFTLLDLTVREAMDQYPEILPVLKANGLEMFADVEIRTTLGAAVRLRTALRARGINADLFNRMLDDAIAAARSRADSHSSLIPVKDNLNLYALLPCHLA